MVVVEAAAAAAAAAARVGPALECPARACLKTQ